MEHAVDGVCVPGGERVLGWRCVHTGALFNSSTGMWLDVASNSFECVQVQMDSLQQMKGVCVRLQTPRQKDGGRQDKIKRNAFAGVFL